MSQDTARQTELDSETLLGHTSAIVSAHVGNNPISPADVPELIQSVHKALMTINEAIEPEEELVPAVPIKKSIRPDYLICLEDGRQLKMLKRHLKTAYDMTPEEYRAKWGLPHDYPMVAPNYAKQRSDLARKIGLGRQPRAATPPAPARKTRSRSRAAA